MIWEDHMLKPTVPPTACARHAKGAKSPEQMEEWVEEAVRA